MFKKLTVLMGTAMLTLCIVGAPMDFFISDADAKGFRSSSSFSRSSFRSSSSSGGRSRSLFKSHRPKKTASARKFTSNKGKTVKTGSKRKASVTKQQAKRTKSVLKAKRQRQQFKKKPASTVKGGNAGYKKKYNSNPVYSRARRTNRDTYYDRRDSYYGGWNTPSYVYMGSPSFGMWDTLFLYSLLNNNNNAGNFAHHHKSDPDYIKWRQEAETLAESNADLRKQLAAMDAAAANVTGPTDPNYLPKGVDADIAMSQEALASQIPEFRTCVGGRSGAYFTIAAGVMAPNLSKVNLTTVETQGSGQALKYITEGKCDAAFVQGDSYWNYIERNETTDLPFERVFSPYRESVHLMCKEDGPNEISDLGKKHKVWFPSQSGAAETWTNFIGEEEDYAKVQTTLNNKSMSVASNEEALLKVIGGTSNDCLMYVSAKGATKFMRKVEMTAKTNKLVLIDIDDGDLDDTEDPSGSDVYDFEQIDQSIYGNLSRQAGVVWGGGDIDTVTVNADFIVSTKWKKAHEKLYPGLALDIMSLQDRIKGVVKPL